MSPAATGHLERLPSGSYRVHVYAGTDPLSGRAIRHRQTVKTAEEARIALGRLIELASAGRRPDSRATVADLLAQFMTVAELEFTTRQTYEGYIRRTILPALGSMELRKLRGPILDTFYARLRRCGDMSCTGRPFTEHRRFPLIAIDPRSRRSAWQHVAEQIRAAIDDGRLAPGEELPSAAELAALSGLPLATVRHALEALAAEKVVTAQQGRRPVVPGESDGVADRRSHIAEPGHDCARCGCLPHQCRPLSARTIRQVHSILSGALAAAVRWEWLDRNPAGSAKLPKARPRSPASPSPSTVAAVIGAARRLEMELLAVYIWLAAITGARRGELCGLQWNDIDLDAGAVTIAFSYTVRGGQKERKDTKTHQVRRIAIDKVTTAMLTGRWSQAETALEHAALTLAPTAYVFSSDPLGTTPWNPDWVTHKVAEVAVAAGVRLNVKALRHYTASQLLAAGVDLRNTAARLGHGGGGATTLRDYADPVSEVDRRAAAYLSQLTGPAVAASDGGATAVSS